MNKVFIVAFFINANLETFKIREKLYRFKYYDDAFDNAIKMLKDKKAEKSFVYEITEETYQKLLTKSTITKEDLKEEDMPAEFHAYKKYPNPQLKQC